MGPSLFALVLAFGAQGVERTGRLGEGESKDAIDALINFFFVLASLLGSRFWFVLSALLFIFFVVVFIRMALTTQTHLPNERRLRNKNLDYIGSR